MNFLNKSMEFFSGKKTYIIGLLMITLGLMQGNQEMTLTGLGFLFTRAAITKI